MSRMKITLAGLLLVASPCWSQTADFTPEERFEGEQTVQDAAAFFRQSLRDPSSAAFRNVHIGKRPPPMKTLKVVVCGEVNARNGFGGYTGFQPFIASAKVVNVKTVAGFSVYEACYSDRVFDDKDYSADLNAAVASGG